MSVDAEFWTKHALVSLHKIELAQVSLRSVRIINFRQGRKALQVEIPEVFVDEL